MIFFAYIGFDAVSHGGAGGEEPAADMPIGILGSLGDLHRALHPRVARDDRARHYTELNVPHPVVVAIEQRAQRSPGSALHQHRRDAGLASVVLVMLMGQPRIFYSMSRDGLLPAVFGKVHPKFRTPYLTTISPALVVGRRRGHLPDRTARRAGLIGTLLAFVIVCAGVIVLRYKRPDLRAPVPHAAGAARARSSAF